MDPHKTKAFTVTLVAVAIISLATNLILLGRLHRTSRQAAKWEKAHERLTHRYLLLEKQKDSQVRFQVKKQESFSQTTNELQPADEPRHSKKSSKFPVKPQSSLVEGSERNNDFYREDIQDMLAQALETEFPELKLNETELIELTDAVISIRESMHTMRAMERTGDNAEAFEEIRERRDQAMLDFERITGMNALEFMLRAPTEGGIDRE
jgi:hypothetical protein